MAKSPCPHVFHNLMQQGLLYHRDSWQQCTHYEREELFKHNIHHNKLNLAIAPHDILSALQAMHGTNGKKQILAIYSSIPVFGAKSKKQ